MEMAVSGMLIIIWSQEGLESGRESLMKSTIPLYILLFITLPSFVMAGDYVTTADVRIYERPDERSHIIFDLPRFRKIAVEPINRDWARVVAVGTDTVNWCREPGTGEFSEGKYSQSVVRLCVDKEVLAQNGFVQLNRVAAFPPEAPPFLSGGFRQVEQFWQEWGIYDDRQLVVDIERHPFNAIVRVLMQGDERPPKFGPFKWSRDEVLGFTGCSGAIVYAKNIVLTADHCIKNYDAPLTVRIERGSDLYEDIQARVIAHGRGREEYDPGRRDSDGDWAVLSLDREPRLPVEPLEFAEQMDWSAMTAYSGVAVGYPADMMTHSRNALGFLAPVVSVCRPDMVTYYSVKQTTEITLYSPCEIFNGNSGGPLLVWQPAIRKFGIIGVASNGGRELSIVGLKAYKDSEHQRERLLSRINSFSSHQFSKKELQVSKKVLDADRSDSLTYFITGISKLDVWDHGYYQSRYSIGKGTVEAVRSAAGLPKLDSDYWQDHRYLGFFFLQSTKPVGNPGSLRGYQFTDHGEFIIKDVVEVRKQCAATCDRGDLDPTGQQPWTYRDILDRAKIRDLVQSGKAGYARFSVQGPDVYEPENRHRKADFEKTQFLAHLAPTDKPLALHLMTGGDLFIIDRHDFSVIGVQRNFMNLRREGLPFNESFSRRHAPRDPATGERRSLDEHDGIGEDFGVDAVASLRNENFGQPTPLTVPGGRLIGTQELRDKLRSKTPPVVIAAMNDPYGLPGAVAVDYASTGGTFTDETQTKLAVSLKKLTEGKKHKEVVIYCHHSKCWLSYNAILRVSRLGYTNLRWYRGGVAAWIDAGLELDEVHQLATQDAGKGISNQ